MGGSIGTDGADGRRVGGSRSSSVSSGEVRPERRAALSVADTAAAWSRLVGRVGWRLRLDGGRGSGSGSGGGGGGKSMVEAERRGRRARGEGGELKLG